MRWDAYHRGMRRRDFIKGSGAAAVACVTVPLCGCDKKPTNDEPANTTAELTWVFFMDPREREIANTAINRLLPDDLKSGAPSAQQLHVLQYMERQLVEPHFRDLHRMMHGGFDFLDKVAIKRYGGTFVTRTTEVQDTILSQFQVDGVSGLKFPQARFFETLQAFALEGYWGQPKYGGNFERRAWAWVSINPHCNHIHATCGE